MGATITIVQAMLVGAAMLAIVRALRGPTLTDRMVALDLVLLLFAGALAAQSARAGSTVFFPVLIVIALVAFASTVLVARFIEWRDTK